MEFPKGWHQAYLQTEKGDAARLIAALEEKCGKGDFTLTLRGSNRWFIASKNKLSSADLDELRRKSIKNLKTRSRPDGIQPAVIGRYSTSGSALPSPSSGPREGNAKRALTFKTIGNVVIKLLQLRGSSDKMHHNDTAVNDPQSPDSAHDDIRHAHIPPNTTVPVN